MKYLLSAIYYDGDFVSQPAAIAEREITSEFEAREMVRQYIHQLPDALEGGPPVYDMGYGEGGIRVNVPTSAKAAAQGWNQFTAQAKHTFHEDGSDQWTVVYVELLDNVRTF